MLNRSIKPLGTTLGLLQSGESIDVAIADLKRFKSSEVMVENYPDFLSACMAEETVVLSKGYYEIGNVTIPNTAKLKTLIIRNSTLKLTDYNLVFERAADLFIDLSNNGVIDLGLKKALVLEDVAPGATKIKIDNPGLFKVGDHLTTSTLAVTPSKWANSIRVDGDAFNVIQAINGNELTMQYGVDAGFVLYRNTYVANAKFNQSGLTFKGNGQVTISGGSIKESRAGYYVSLFDQVKLVTRNVNFSGQFLDGFLMRDNTELYFQGGSIYGSYDPAKQTVVFDSTGDLTFDNVRVHRGNFDVEIYYSSGITAKRGKLRIINGCEFDGTSLLPLKAEQADTINGGTVGDKLTNITDSLHVQSIQVGTHSDVLIENSSFKNYRRGLTGTNYVGAQGDVTVDSITLRNVTTDCTPFYFKKNTYAYNVGSINIQNLDVRRFWNGSYYPLGYSELGIQINFGGKTRLNPNGFTDTSSVSDLFVFDTLEFYGAGTSRIPSTLKVNRLIVDTGVVNVVGTTNSNPFTDVLRLNNGALSSNPFAKNYAVGYGIRWAANSAVFNDVVTLPTQGGNEYFGILQIAPRHSVGSTCGLAGQIAFHITEAAAEVTVAAADAATIIGNNTAQWITKPLGMAIDPATVVVKLKITSGVLQVNVIATKDVGSVVTVL